MIYFLFYISFYNAYELFAQFSHTRDFSRFDAFSYFCCCACALAAAATTNGGDDDDDGGGRQQNLQIVAASTASTAAAAAVFKSETFYLQREETPQPLGIVVQIGLRVRPQRKQRFQWVRARARWVHNIVVVPVRVLLSHSLHVCVLYKLCAKQVYQLTLALSCALALTTLCGLLLLTEHDRGSERCQKLTQVLLTHSLASS